MRKLSLTVILGALRGKLVLPLLAIAVFSPTWLAAQTLPTPDHIVIVIEENRSLKELDYFIEHHPKSYLARLKGEGAYFTSFFTRLHPSQPNYIELFSGDRYEVWNDEPCPKDHPCPKIDKPNIGSLISFTGYAEGLPRWDFDGKSSGSYVRKHCPWISFTGVSQDNSKPFTEFKDFASLPKLSFVIPNQKHDMHGQPLQTALGFVLKLFKKDPLMKAGDVWLEQNLKAYAEWAKSNNSLLIVTWDEDDHQATCIKTNHKKSMEHPCETEPPKMNKIPTIFVGQMVKSGPPITTQYTHLDLLRTIEEMSGVKPEDLLGKSKNAKQIIDWWK